MLDPRTIIFANFVYTLAISIYMAYFGFKSSRQYPGLNWWSRGFFLTSLSFLMLFFSSLSPPLRTVAYLFPVTGLLLIKQGYAVFHRVDSSKWPDLVLFFSAAVAFILVMNRPAKVQLVVIVLCALSAYTLTVLMLRRTPDRGILRWLYAFAGITQLARLWIGLQLPSDSELIYAGSQIAAISMLLFISLTMIAMSQISLMVRRWLRDRDNLLRQEREVSLYDELTGLLNRRGFKTLYQVEEKRIIRQRLPVSLVMADIDHFKLVNDRHGHECGDIVLQMVTEVMKQQLRGGDILARWGGEEFIILQPETDSNECRIALERTRKAIAARTVEYNGQTVSVTMSFGYRTIMSGNLSFEPTLKQADENLYSAKESGRNRVEGSADD